MFTFKLKLLIIELHIVRKKNEFTISLELPEKVKSIFITETKQTSTKLKKAA